MRSKGSRFTLGVWGLRVSLPDVAFMLATVRNRPQPSATVRNRPREPRMAVPMVSSAKGSLLEVSHVALLRFAWQARHFVTVKRAL